VKSVIRLCARERELKYSIFKLIVIVATFAHFECIGVIDVGQSGDLTSKAEILTGIIYSKYKAEPSFVRPLTTVIHE
jgi:hypothetical protein